MKITIEISDSKYVLHTTGMEVCAIDRVTGDHCDTGSFDRRRVKVARGLLLDVLADKVLGERRGVVGLSARGSGGAHGSRFVQKVLYIAFRAMSARRQFDLMLRPAVIGCPQGSFAWAADTRSPRVGFAPPRFPDKRVHSCDSQGVQRCSGSLDAMDKSGPVPCPTAHEISGCMWLLATTTTTNIYASALSNLTATSNSEAGPCGGTSPHCPVTCRPPRTVLI